MTQDDSTDPPVPSPLPPPPAPSPAPLGNQAFAPIGPPDRSDARSFSFDGGAATYIGTALLALLITVVTVGLAFPFALVLRQRWQAKHTFVEGRQLQFTGTGIGLFGNWIKWLLLTIITLGIYSFWVVPRIIKWTVEHQEFSGAQLATS